MKKDQAIALLALIFFAALIIVATILIKAYSWPLVIGGLLTFLVITAIVWSIVKKLRFSRLLDKYGNEEIANKIMKRALWQGQTAEQVIDSLGEPKDIDEKY